MATIDLTLEPAVTLLLLAGGLSALQAATLLAALLFCIIMLMLTFGLVRQTDADLVGVALAEEGASVSERLKRLVRSTSMSAIAAFTSSTAISGTSLRASEPCRLFTHTGNRQFAGWNIGRKTSGAL